MTAEKDITIDSFLKENQEEIIGVALGLLVFAVIALAVNDAFDELSK